MKTNQDIMNEVAKVINDIPELKQFYSSPRFRYYTNKKTKDQFFYTVEKINHNGKPRYVAGIYRYLKTRKVYKMTGEVGFAKKKDAMARAYKFYKASI